MTDNEMIIENQRLIMQALKELLIQGIPYANSELRNELSGRIDLIKEMQSEKEKASIDLRPVNCRNRLRDEGKPYPRSGCESCRNGGLMRCPHERRS